MTLRKFPYPYRSGFSINSDIDGCTPYNFVQVHKFMNTEENTIMGPGVGLDIADSFWVYLEEGSDGFSVSQANSIENKSAYAEMILRMIEQGYIDTFHSIGAYGTSIPANLTRSEIEAAFEYLARAGKPIRIWVNHGDSYNIQNWGGDYVGDTTTSQLHSSDLAVEQGVMFYWASSDNITNQGKSDLLTTIATLRDGNKVFLFKRFQGVAGTPQSYDLVTQINYAITNKTSGNYVIVYNHIGSNPNFPWKQSVIDAFRNLKTEFDNGYIWVTTASKLLMYNYVSKYLDYTQDGNTITINHIDCPLTGTEVYPTVEELQGLTFYDDHPENLEIQYQGEQLETQVNPTDGTNKSISIPVTRLPPIKLPHKARRIKRNLTPYTYTPDLTSRPPKMEVHVDQNSSGGGPAVNYIEFLSSGEIRATGRVNMFRHVELLLDHKELDISLKFKVVSGAGQATSPSILLYYDYINYIGLQFVEDSLALSAVQRYNTTAVATTVGSYTKNTYYTVRILVENGYAYFYVNDVLKKTFVLPSVRNGVPQRLIIGKGRGSYNTLRSYNQTVDYTDSASVWMAKEISIDFN